MKVNLLIELKDLIFSEEEEAAGGDRLPKSITILYDSITEMSALRDGSTIVQFVSPYTNNVKIQDKFVEGHTAITVHTKEAKHLIENSIKKKREAHQVEEDARAAEVISRMEHQLKLAHKMKDLGATKQVILPGGPGN